ncbi:L-histidine N(alpha)-methyltransferase [Qipengyuania atrilutea]|uniref:L-histidine N(Alpha)-methyltransferase n=1 Tax=Qipengyuania atrilutea TaxID=2744473 RepID=A0A850GX53_9SPHN|nr:L-histidine N(alpha)-methyltransferase [Actirhodobacter atriluteus]NVD44164.1 L-histidine N(alpha)-methyltransferase [Actirhodobacter atriluteus]
MNKAQGIALVERDADGVDRAFRKDVLEGMRGEQKAIPARWLYDDAGSQLFEDITEVPEYYPTRSETEILESQSRDFADLIGSGRAVVEFGSGSSVKTPLLLSAIEPAAYVPLDIAGDFLRAAADQLQGKFPNLPIYPVEADFMRRVELPAEVSDMPKLGFFPGSTIGNMIASSAVDLLRSMRATLLEGQEHSGDRTAPMLLIGMDLVKDVEVLKAAYDDAAGVTAEFNRNVARRMNRELDGDIPVDALRHEARWNDEVARIEMHLVATREIAFTLSGERFTMLEGETIHTENSHKFTERSSNLLLMSGGWSPVKRWTDSEDRFSLILARSMEPRKAP